MTSPVTSVEEHRAEVEEWRERRYEALRRDLGWLTLAGLGWLNEGENRVGASPGADVTLASGPAVAGTITVRNRQATARGRWLHHGSPVDDLPLTTDREGEPTLLELGSLRLCVIERGGRLAIRTWDLDAAPRTAFTGIDHWPVDRAWSLHATLEPTPGRTLPVPDVIGFVEELPSPGIVHFQAGGLRHRLDALEGGDDGKLWLVFGDATNGAETYGGGRFVYTEPPLRDGRVVVDFNRAYNPPCVFTPYATCPLPWPANRLPIRVEAGERRHWTKVD